MITSKKIIFKAHYKNGKFWYFTKIYDKNYVEVVNVFDENDKERLLSSKFTQTDYTLKSRFYKNWIYVGLVNF